MKYETTKCYEKYENLNREQGKVELRNHTKIYTEKNMTILNNTMTHRKYDWLCKPGCFVL